MSSTGGGFASTHGKGITTGNKQLVNNQTISMRREANFDGAISGTVCGVPATSIDVNQVMADVKSTEQKRPTSTPAGGSGIGIL